MNEEYIKGPCNICGDSDYMLSTSGPGICPPCACYSPQVRLRELRSKIKSLQKRIKIYVQFERVNEILKESLTELRRENVKLNDTIKYDGGPPEKKQDKRPNRKLQKRLNKKKLFQPR